MAAKASAAASAAARRVQAGLMVRLNRFRSLAASALRVRKTAAVAAAQNNRALAAVMRQWAASRRFAASRQLPLGSEGVYRGRMRQVKRAKIVALQDRRESGGGWQLTFLNQTGSRDTASALPRSVAGLLQPAWLLEAMEKDTTLTAQQDATGIHSSDISRRGNIAASARLLPQSTLALSHPSILQFWESVVVERSVPREKEKASPLAIGNQAINKTPMSAQIDCAHYLRPTIAQIVGSTARTQSIKGIITAGPFKAGVYAYQKLEKYFRAILKK
jgi:hypothetical protein